MKGFITKALNGMAAAVALWTAAGCSPYYHNVVDPCWPERYNAMAYQEEREGFITQAINGHVLDQTIWNAQFEKGTANLTPAARENLIRLTRRRPCPDTTIYVQSAQDLPYNPAAPQDFAKARDDLNNRRAEEVRKFLLAETAGSGLAFNVLVHNPETAGMPGVPANNAVKNWFIGPPRGLVPVGVGAAGSGGAGGAGGAGGGAGGAGAGAILGTTGSF